MTIDNGNETQFFRYYQTREATSWEQVPASEVGNLISMQRPALVTALETTYNEADPATHDAPLQRGELYADFDADDVTEAVRASIGYIEKLKALGVDPECLDIYLSGGKGVHIFVPRACYMPASHINIGVQGLASIYHAMVTDADLIKDGIDLRIYNSLGMGRMLRQSGVRRKKDGRFKVAVSLSELQEATDAEKYVEFVGAPRDSIKRTAAVYADKLAALYVLKQKEVTAQQVKIAKAKEKRAAFVASDDDADIEVERVKSALAQLDADKVDYSIWLRVGMALHSTGWSDGLDLWASWSKSRSPVHTNTAANCDGVWRSFKGSDGVGLGTLIKYAKDAGWIDPHPRKPKRFEVRDGWLYRIFKNPDTGPLKICTEVHAVMECRNDNSEDWGTLIEFKDADGVEHRVHVLHSFLMADFSRNVISPLSGQGLRFNVSGVETKVRDAFKLFLQVGCDSERRGLLVSRPGWHGDQFILGSRTIGPGSDTADEIILAGDKVTPYAEAGTLKGWQDDVAKFASGNSRLIFALSTAFAAPLLKVVGMDGGGFNLRGNSSIGKSSLLRVSASVWGAPLHFVQRWRATDNGLEAVALRHNDCLLPLDEVSEIDPKKLENTLYMLANGGGKTRMKKEGGIRDPALWRVLMLSSGEESAAEALATIGNSLRAGADVRMADVIADAGAGFGCWENLHGEQDGGQLSDRLKGAADCCYGTAGPAFLAEVCKGVGEHREWLIARVRELSASWVENDSGGQVCRVADRFALVGAAGELAAKLGILPLSAGEAIRAAEVCFRVWLAGRSSGSDNAESHKLVEHVLGFLATHWLSRFAEIRGGTLDHEDRTVHNLVGYREDITGDGDLILYKVPADNLKQILGPFAADRKRSLEALASAGVLLRGTDANAGKHYTKGRLPGGHNGPYYTFRAVSDA